MISELNTDSYTPINTVASPPPIIGKVTTEKNSDTGSTPSLLSTPADTDTVTLSTTGTLDAVKAGASDGTKKYATDSTEGMKIAEASEAYPLKVEELLAAIRAMVVINGGKLDPDGRTAYRLTTEQVKKGLQATDTIIRNKGIGGTPEADALIKLQDLVNNDLNEARRLAILANLVDETKIVNVAKGAIGVPVNLEFKKSPRTFLSDYDIFEAADRGHIEYVNPPTNKATYNSKGKYGLNND